VADAQHKLDPSALPVSPSLEIMLESDQTPQNKPLVDSRVLLLCFLAIVVGFVMAGVAHILLALIFFVTNFSFFGIFSLHAVSPADNHLGLWVIGVPAIGGIIVGFMARYGAKAIRGHGIPEAMEQVLTNRSRIPARITFLKPLSAAVAIGTGGPFGAEGPIIATGGALGSLVGQLLHTSAIERKTLLAAGAAAGMSATFGSPVSAVLLAVELLLFEYRPRSLVPVALASATAAGMRVALEGHAAIFPMPNLADPTMAALTFYIFLGAVIGIFAVGITKLVYHAEDLFEHLPIHWMWWPALGGIVVGVIGYFAPRTLGVGYVNISDALEGKFVFQTALMLCAMKFISWSIALGSGTSGGTLAPLLTIGGCLGAAIGIGFDFLLPHFAIDIRIAALVGMAAMFAGASRALLTSVVFAFETTLQPLGLLPLLGGCSASYLISCYLMPQTIMTERISRRGIRASGEYSADVLEQMNVAAAASKKVVTLRSNQSLQEVRQWLANGADGATHQGFPVIDERDILVGVITRRDLADATAPPDAPLKNVLRQMPRYVHADCTLRQATEHMVNHDIGRLPVVSRTPPGRVIGIVTRTDILSAYRHALKEQDLEAPNIKLRLPKRRSGTA
jgi:H+/Cl- antiporter ClcA/CBS domain-containing protein